MDSADVTALISRIMIKMRKGRSLFQPPTMAIRKQDAVFAEIWFPTSGCRWDFAGRCTLCNYGHPEPVTPGQMLGAVEEALAALHGRPAILWVSAFNVFDDREVPPETRHRLFRMLALPHCEHVICETHPHSVDRDKVAACKRILGDRRLDIQIGIESTSDFVRNVCINKGVERSEIRRAISEIRAGGAGCYGNLVIGAPFLDARDAYHDALVSTCDALAMGCDKVCLFPSHVKPHTLLHWLHARRQYEPVSLWALADIYAALSEEQRVRVYHSWITPVDHPGADNGVAPEVDPQCGGQLIDNLTRFQQARDPAAMAWLTETRTPARERWHARLAGDGRNAAERAAAVLPELCDEFLGAGRWSEVGAGVLADLNQRWCMELEARS